ncbi:hypothetical protein OO013_02620 [Mangrovivirga sp. M17]|uniref:PQQ-binding-like beta-propeller repeat protein n=1 Tax=Mangrovivirga halotolerans TaxID=2993936 RepID=A0ABT3RME9_9BACT|nr:hypothetical protein [Mangrovivirga halotolerans]MCX2742740.1 hypothetical protein [Mangrovivirga halotolerans]
MKWKFLSITFLIVFYNSFAQNKSDFAEIKWGNTQKVRKGIMVKNVVGKDQKDLFILKSNTPIYNSSDIVLRGRYRYQLARYDHGLKLKKQAQIEPNVNGERADYEGIVQLDDKLILLSSFEDPATRNLTLAAQQIDKNTLLTDKSYKKLSVIKQEGFSWKEGFFNYILSKDSSKLFVYYKLPRKNKENDAFGMHVFDTNLNELWHEEVTLPYNEKMFYVKDLLVDNDGNAHVLGRLYKEKDLLGQVKTRRKGDANYHYRIISFYQRGKVMDDNQIEVEDHFLNDMQIRTDKAMNIICSGFYSNEGSRNIKGAYYLRINSKTKETDISSFQDFSTELLSEGASDREKRKLERKEEKGKDEELESFDIDKMILKDDGGVILVAEKYYSSTYTVSNGNGGYSTRTTYHFNDILVVSLNSDGTVAWSKLIEKKQSGLTYSSYSVAAIEDRLYILYNENEKNLNRDKDDTYVTLYGWKKWNATLTEIDSQGNMKAEVLFNCKEAGTINIPTLSEQISPNEIIIYNYRKKKGTVAKLTFKQKSNKNKSSTSP